MNGNVNMNNCSGDIERKIKTEEAFDAVDQDFENGKIQEKDLLKEQQKRLQEKGLYPEAANILKYRHKIAKYHGEDTASMPEPEQYLASAEAMKAAGISNESINEKLNKEV